VLRRSGPDVSARRPKALHMDEEKFKATLNGNDLMLTPVEFALLRTLSGQEGRVFSRDQLMNEMYQDYRVVSDRAVDTHIKNLRKKISDASGSEDMIKSVYGLGYRYEG
jgi:two-component system response regulator BaeR